VVSIKPRIEVITPIFTEGFMKRSYRYQENLWTSIMIEVIHQVLSKETAKLLSEFYLSECEVEFTSCFIMTSIMIEVMTVGTGSNPIQNF